jgi:hypothetical protein
MMDVQEETLGEAGFHQCSKGTRLNGASTSEEGEDIWQDLQEGLVLEMVERRVEPSVRI